MGKVPRLLRARRLGQIHNEKNGMCMMATVSSKDGDTVAKAEFVPVKRGKQKVEKRSSSGGNQNYEACG